MSEATPITFESGYRRMQAIVEEVNQSEIPVDRMADLFAEGKGLDKALTDHLDAQKARIEKIERGEGIQAFRVVGSTDEAAASPEGPTTDASDFPTASSSSDDIPF